MCSCFVSYHEEKAPDGQAVGGFQLYLAESLQRIARLVCHKPDIHTGQPQRDQTARTANLHHDVLEIVV